MTPDTLLAQLDAANHRSQYFMTQFWQVPFAFLGLSVIGVASAGQGGKGGRDNRDHPHRVGVIHD